MKKILLILAVVFASCPLWASDHHCEETKTAVIDSDAKCVDQGGISIGLSDEEGAKVACLQSKEVQNQCGPDGRVTRVHAYTLWFDKLKKFEDTCSAEGGTFSYKDANFTEPQDESFCMEAIPEVGSNMFEEPLCNYHSFCPAVTVVCEKSCPSSTIARLY